MILTDSGGLQKEAYFFSKPCLTMRDETEWVELVDGGFNKLVGADTDNILEAYSKFTFNTQFDINLYGNGDASKRIVERLLK